MWQNKFAYETNLPYSRLRENNIIPWADEKKISIDRCDKANLPCE